MRKALLVGIPVSVLGLGLAAYVGMRPAEKKSNDAFANDLQRAQAAGIELAQAQGANKFALSETVPEAKPEPTRTIKKGAGPKAVRSSTPTVMASPEAAAAEVVEEIPQLTMVSVSSAPSPAEVSAPAVPRPAAATEPAPSQDQGPILAGGTGRGAGRTGTEGNGGGWGGIFGAVIRGGGVDGDNCDPRPRSASRPPMRTPVYGTPGTGTQTVRPGNPIGGGISPRTRGRG